MSEYISFKSSSPAGDLVSFLAGMKQIYQDTGKRALIYQRLGMPGISYTGSIHPFENEEGEPVCMNKYMIALLMLAFGRQALAADQKVAAAAAGAGALAVARPVASAKNVDYEKLMAAYGYTQALTSKPAGIGAAAGFLVSRAVKASAPATLAAGPATSS